MDADTGHEELCALPILDKQAFFKAAVAEARRALELRTQAEGHYDPEQMRLVPRDEARWWSGSGDTENFYDWERCSDGLDVNLEPLDYYGGDYENWEPWMSDEGYMSASYHDAARGTSGVLEHKHVRRTVDFAAQAASRESHEAITTLMLRSMPRNFTRRKLMALLDESGYKDKYDFLYLPLDSNTRCSVGYAFVNFDEEHTATAFQQKMRGYAFPGYNDPKDGKKRAMHISIAHLQGVRANLTHLSCAAVLASNAASRPWFRELEEPEGCAYYQEQVEDEDCINHFLYRENVGDDEWNMLAADRSNWSALEADMPDEKLLWWATPPPGYMPEDVTAVPAGALETFWQLPHLQPPCHEVTETLVWLAHDPEELLCEDVPGRALLTSEGVLAFLGLILRFALPISEQALLWPQRVSLLPQWSRYFNFLAITSGAHLAAARRSSRVREFNVEGEISVDRLLALPRPICALDDTTASARPDHEDLQHQAKQPAALLAQALAPSPPALLAQALAPGPVAFLVQALTAEGSQAAIPPEPGLGFGHGLDSEHHHDAGTAMIPFSVGALQSELPNGEDFPALTPITAKGARAGRGCESCQPISRPPKTVVSR